MACPTFPPTTPHFFKIILDNTSRDRKLRIPEKFVMGCGDGLSNPVYLKLPSGSEWKIELRRWDGEVWLDKGWPGFSKFCSLDLGHCLVFGYEGNSKFHVCIFDGSCTEVYYPLTMPQMEETQCDDDSRGGFCDVSFEDSDENSVEMFNFPPCPRKTREKSTLPCPRPHKKCRRSSSGRHDFPTKKGGGGTSGNRTGKATALDRAYAFKSQNPSSFIVSMRPNYINNWSLWLPSEFHKLHPIKHSCEVILQVSNGRTWSVDLNCGKGRTTFGHGWMDVVRDNHLKTGDVCVFVSISNSGIPLFDVVLFRSGEGSKCTNDGEQTVPMMEETDDEDGDSSDDFGDDSSDDSVEILDKFPPPRKKRVVKGKDGFLAKKGGGGTSSTRRFQKRTPGFLERMHPSTKSYHEDDPEFFHPSQKQRRVLQ